MPQVYPKGIFTFKVGDRITALRGVSPGSNGIVTRLDKDYEINDIVNVTYDGGNKDVIYGWMLEPEGEYDMD